MAVVQHGSSLPDEAGKSDFYGIVDNATVSGITNDDISAGAAISDTKLDTIMTTGKVNASAITGQIPNAQLVQITTSGKVTGDALTLLGNIAAGAGIIPSANLPSFFSILDYGSGFSSPVQRGNASGILKIAYGQTGTGVPGSGSQTITGLNFTTGYSVVVGNYTTFPCIPSAKSNTQFTLTNSHNDASGGNGNCDWLAVGT